MFSSVTSGPYQGRPSSILRTSSLSGGRAAAPASTSTRTKASRWPFTSMRAARRPWPGLRPSTSLLRMLWRNFRRGAPVTERTARSGRTTKAAGGPSATPSALLGRVEGREELGHVVGVLLLDGQDRLHHPPGGDVVVAQVAHDLRVRLDGDPLRHQVLHDHVHQRVALAVLGVAAAEQPIGV